MSYEFASAENIGDRKEQQDRVLVASHPSRPEITLALVADGMGGHTGGALAAQSVVDAIEPMFAAFDPDTESPAEWLNCALVAAHERVAATGQGFNRDPRSTCVLVLAQPGRMDWAHCGDSRLYLFRDSAFVRRTEDHSLVEILVQQGKITELESLDHPERSKLFSSLGGNEPPQVTLGGIDDVRPGDTVVLCSDGLWTYFRAAEMADLTSYRTLTAACDRLIGLARHRADGTGDNVSMAMIRQPAPTSRPGLLGKLFGPRAVVPSPLEDARRFVINYLRVHMGPEADGVTGKLEACKTPLEFAECLPKYHDIIAHLIGEQRAALFTKRALGLLEET